MKKQLLLVLTVVMLMCTCMFGASAARNCEVDGHSFTIVKADSYVAPGCETPGYTKYYCECGDFEKKNYVSPLGHEFVDFEYQKAGDGSYRKYQKCSRWTSGAGNVCNFGNADGWGNEVDLNSAEVVYYLVQFINGQSLATKEDSIKYTTLAKTTEDVVLQASYVKKGDTLVYRGSKPYRYKDMDYGAYTFVGWTREDLDTVTSSTPIEVGEDLYKLVLTNVNASVNYYAAWRSEEVYYKVIVYSSDGTQLLNPQSVLHGQSISYDYSYAPKESEPSVDYEFKGWIVGKQNLDVENADASNSTFNYYAAPEVVGESQGIHIKNVPIYGYESVRAYHEAIPRQYKVAFCDAKWNVKSAETIIYNSDVTGLINFDYSNPNLEDENYVYSYTGKWETKSGHKMLIETLALPAGSVDHDDEIYMFDKDFKLIENEYGRTLTLEELKLYYDIELANYNKAQEELKRYEPGMFNLNEEVYIFPVHKVNGVNTFLLDGNGKKVCVVLNTNGIFLLDENSNRTLYTDTQLLDEDLRTIKIRPVYNRRANTYVMDILVNIPADEPHPEDYRSLVVQVTDKNGYLLDSAQTEYNELTNTVTCRLYVTKSDRYNVTVASPENGKYFGERTIVWDVFKAMLDANGYVKEPIIIDLKVTDDYTQSVEKRCGCLCHSIFSGIWVRVLNVVYSIFNVKLVCCHDMYISIGNLLIYQK